MIEPIIQNVPITRIKAIYNSEGSPFFTSQKCSIFHNRSGLPTIAIPNNNNIKSGYVFLWKNIQIQPLGIQLQLEMRKLERIADKKVARKTGIEPATSTVTGWYSNQLSYFPTQLIKRCLI